MMEVGLQARETAVIAGVAGAVMVIFAVPSFVGSSDDVALTVSEPEVGAVAGAVYKPVFEIVPETADQVTLELKLPVPVTVAEHWLVCEGWRLAAAQETLTDVMAGAAGVEMAIFAVPSFVESSVDVALTSSEPDVGTVAGAV